MSALFESEFKRRILHTQVVRSKGVHMCACACMYVRMCLYACDVCVRVRVCMHLFVCVLYAYSYKYISYTHTHNTRIERKQNIGILHDVTLLTTDEPNVERISVSIHTRTHKYTYTNTIYSHPILSYAQTRLHTYERFYSLQYKRTCIHILYYFFSRLPVHTTHTYTQYPPTLFISC